MLKDLFESHYIEQTSTMHAFSSMIDLLFLLLIFFALNEKVQSFSVSSARATLESQKPVELLIENDTTVLLPQATGDTVRYRFSSDKASLLQLVGGKGVTISVRGNVAASTLGNVMDKIAALHPETMGLYVHK